MARASVRTKLSLTRYARIMGINPLHFEGVRLSAVGTSTCDEVWYQQSWMDADRVSREDVAQAIHEAERRIERYLGFRLLPTWEADEWHGLNRPHQPETFRMGGVDFRQYPLTVKTDWSKFLSGGVRSKDLVSAGVGIAYSDPDGDGYSERATVVIGTTALNGCEMRAYYPSKGGADTWEIRPITVTIAAGIATITFRREQVVIEALLDQVDNQDVPVADGLDNAHFLTTVDVYRVYNDPQRQIQFLWEPLASGCDCGNSGCATCAYSTQFGCLHTRGRREAGVVAFTPATWNTTTLTFDSASWAAGRQPDAARLWYYAGYQGEDEDCPLTEMDSQFARLVSYLATSLLPRTTCSCNRAAFDRWQQDLASSGLSSADSVESFRLSPRDLDCPFGTRRGAVYAWKALNDQDLAIAPSAILV